MLDAVDPLEDDRLNSAKEGTPMYIKMVRPRSRTVDACENDGWGNNDDDDARK